MRHPALPLRPRHRYAVDIPCGLPTQHLQTCRESPHLHEEGRASRTGPYPSGLEPAGAQEASTTGSVSLYLPLSFTGPGPSDSPRPSRLRRGRLPPSPAPPEVGCLLLRPARHDRPDGGVSHPARYAMRGAPPQTGDASWRTHNCTHGMGLPEGGCSSVRTGGLGRTTAHRQPFGWCVSVARPPNPACDFHRTGLSTVERWG